MPWAPSKPCAWPGCANLTNSRFCDSCQPKQWQRENRARGPVDPRYKSARWVKLRIVELAREPMCRECQRHRRIAFAQAIDHILPVEDGGDFWTSTNHQPLCKPCHSAKTLSDLRRRGSLSGRPAQEAYGGTTPQADSIEGACWESWQAAAKCA